ncbi:MAG: maleylpyruvate isomerase family mycothiol-dependent enzyme [Acidimicrobiia bacterium]|nr:maleylpyruvate isomerase family mycothiol-dependent enzyme [Acidimicrobiia bacterium]
MTRLLPKEPVIAALDEEWSSLLELLEGLDDAAWDSATPCPGWDVRAAVAHIIGTESMLIGIDPPAGGDADAERPAHVRNDIGAFNESWVTGLATAPPADLVARLRELTTARLDTLRSMDPVAWDAEGFTPVGRDTHGRFMRIRVFDCWMHELDIRDAIGRPGHESGPAVELALDEMTESLGYVVGKKAGTPAGSAVQFELTGPSGRTISIDVAERATVVESLAGPPTATLRMPVGTFARLAGGRVDPASVADQVELEGDVELGRRVVDNLAFTI